MRKEFVYNNKIMKNRRRQLRNCATDAEVLLWQEIKNSKLGFRFTRQYSVIGYVLDFFCPEKRLGIEVDGNIHLKSEVVIYDTYRIRWLENADIKIIRFRNEEIIKNIIKVIEIIKKNLMEIPTLKSNLRFASKTVRGGMGVLC